MNRNSFAWFSVGAIAALCLFAGISTRANIYNPISVGGTIAGCANNGGILWVSGTTLTCGPATSNSSGGATFTSDVASTPTNTNNLGTGAAQWAAVNTQGVNNQINTLQLKSGGTSYLSIGNGATGGAATTSTGVLGWTAGLASAAFDTGWSRVTGGNAVAAGNGTAGDSSAQVQARFYTASGSQGANTGTCAINTPVGGQVAGQWKANGACAGGTVILAMPTASNGWACSAQDMTTPADTIKQTATGASSVTFTATMAGNDVVAYQCLAY